jgi:pyridoxamine 5'-phosphate oxidase
VKKKPATAELVRRFWRWYRAAERGGQPLIEAMALATATRDGRVSLRYVLLKGADERGFVFFTNLRSRKGRELVANPRAALAFYWEATLRQVRVEGRIERVSEAEAAAYWRTRPRDSQLAAVASAQSEPVASRRVLVAEVARLRRAYRGRDVPRPRHWTGFRVVPSVVEFWTHRDHRLHEREAFTRSARGWKREILQP